MTDHHWHERALPLASHVCHIAAVSNRWLETEMAERVYGVQCVWDPEAKVWVATSDDVPGLATGADTLDALVDKLKVVIPDLLEANGLLGRRRPGARTDNRARGASDISFTITAQRHERAPRAA